MNPIQQTSPTQQQSQKHNRDVFAGFSSMSQSPITSKVVTISEETETKINEFPICSLSHDSEQVVSNSGFRDRVKGLQEEVSPAGHIPPPFLSNSDGAKYLQGKNSKPRGLSYAPNDRRSSQASPIFLGGRYLVRSHENGRIDSNVTDVTSASNISAQDAESANTDIPSQYFLFPPISRQDGKESPPHTKSSSNIDEAVSSKHSSFIHNLDFNRPKSTRRSTVGFPNDGKLLRRRKSISTSFSPLLQNDILESTKPSVPRRISKRQSMFPGSSRSSYQRNSSIARGDITQSSESILQQQRWKNKAFSQTHSFNQKLLQRRLRVGYCTQEILNDLRQRRKSSRRNRNSRIKIFTPLDRFRRMVLLVRLLIRCLVDYKRVTLVSNANQMSFAMLSNDMVAARSYRHGLTFDPNDYRAVKEGLLNEKLREILTLVPHQRTEKQVEYALKCLRAGVEEFAEFPLRMQEALVKVAWLDEFEPKRVIIRQGHKAETFYFIISGTALVTRNRINHSGEGYVETVSILKRGKSFGELAIMRHEQRTNNVVSQTHIALLTVSRKDFVEIFMHRMVGDEPEFISFLRKLPEFEGYPLYKVPRNKPKICAFTYFRVGVVICADSNKSDAIVIVKSGVCRVVKCLNATRPNLPGLREVPHELNYETTSLDRATNLAKLGTEKPILLTSPTSPVSLLTGPKQPTLIRRLTMSFIQSGKSSFSSDWNYNPKYSWSGSENAENLSRTQEEHRRKVGKTYKRWQEEHPISGETFALLMTGRELTENEEEEEEEDDDKENEDKFDIRERLDSYIFQIPMNKENDESQSRRSSIHSNFRTQILKRNRNSLADAWTQRQTKKKMSSISTNLPTLNENVLPHCSDASSWGSSSKSSTNRPVYIHIQTLREKDVFGLLPIVFDKSEGATSVSLVSEGAECILINREFFMKHFDDELRERLVRMVRPYPSDDVLQANMQIQTNWDAYKFMTVHSHVTNCQKSKQVLAPKAMTSPARSTKYKYMLS